MTRETTKMDPREEWPNLPWEDFDRPDERGHIARALLQVCYSAQELEGALEAPPSLTKPDDVWQTTGRETGRLLGTLDVLNTLLRKEETAQC